MGQSTRGISKLQVSRSLSTRHARPILRQTCWRLPNQMHSTRHSRPHSPALDRRNSVLHSDSESVLADIRSKEIAEIKHYHSRPQLLLAADQHYCERSLSRLLSASSSTRRRWLKIVKRSSAELTKDGTRQARITNFFAPI